MNIKKNMSYSFLVLSIFLMSSDWMIEAVMFVQKGGIINRNYSVLAFYVTSSFSLFVFWLAVTQIGGKSWRIKGFSRLIYFSVSFSMIRLILLLITHAGRLENMFLIELNKLFKFGEFANGLFVFSILLIEFLVFFMLQELWAFNTSTMMVKDNIKKRLNLGDAVRQLPLTILFFTLIPIRDFSVIRAVPNGFANLQTRQLEDFVMGVMLAAILYASTEIRLRYVKNLSIDKGVSQARMKTLAVVSVLIVWILPLSTLVLNKDSRIDQLTDVIRRDLTMTGNYVLKEDYINANEAFGKAKTSYYALYAIIHGQLDPELKSGLYDNLLEAGSEEAYNPYDEIALYVLGIGESGLYNVEYMTNAPDVVYPTLFKLYAEKGDGLHLRSIMNRIIYDGTYNDDLDSSFGLTDEALALSYMKDLDELLPAMIKGELYMLLGKATYCETGPDIAEIVIENDNIEAFNKLWLSQTDQTKEIILLDPLFCLKAATILRQYGMEEGWYPAREYTYYELISVFANGLYDNYEKESKLNEYDVMIVSSKLLMYAQDYESSEKILSAARDRYPDSIEIFEIFSDQMIELDMASSIEGPLNDFRKKNKDTITTKYFEARMLLNSKRYDDSVIKFVEAMKENESPEELDRYINDYLMEFFEQLPAEQLVQYTERALATTLPVFDSTMEGFALWKLHRQEEALDRFEKAIQVSDYPAYVNYMAGICCYELAVIRDVSYLDQALSYYWRSKNLAPDNEYVYFTLAYCYRLKDDFDMADTLFGHVEYRFDKLDHNHDPYGLYWHASVARSSMPETEDR